jgi:threonine dehydrogenase-like Zn-dependent dehydrogenase
MALAKQLGADILNYEEVHIQEALIDMTGGIGPDAVVDAVGLESHGFAVDNLYDYAKQAVMLETDRSSALRHAIMACRKGGRVSIPASMGVLSTSSHLVR